MHYQPLPFSAREQRALLEERFGNPQNQPMSPKQRVETAINLQSPDRVPFDFWGVPEIIEKLMTHLNAQDEEELYRLLGIDCRIIWPKYIGPVLETLDDGSFYEPWGSHRRLVHNEYSTYEEYTSYPLAGVCSVEDVKNWEKWPKSSYWDWAGVPQQIDNFNRQVPYHIRYEVGGMFEFAWGVYGLDKFLIDLIDRPEIPCAILDCYTDIFIDNVRSLMQVADNKIDMVYTYDDVATQNGLMMSKKMWAQYILPRHQRLNAAIKEFGIKIMHHCCGAVYPLVQSYIDDMHIDVLNPLQPRAQGMDMQKIKQTFGNRIAFHGGIDLQYTLPHGTQEEVASEVIERRNILAQGGGYICTSAHYIQADVPIENILTMYTTSREVN